jgi:CheY-like chemotaxis protein
MFKFTRTQKKTTEYAAYDLTDLIKQAVDFTMPRWKNMAQANNINYQVDTEGTKEVFSILCNPTEIREVFVNIIHNALEAMPDGGRISFNTRSKDDLVLVNVSDTGKGMTEDVKKNIFDPFFTTRRPEGTGLGMSTSFGIIKMHGGDIKVNSEVGKGSTFTLQFPITRKTVSPEISSEPIEEQDKKCNEIRVLVVDDDEAICKLLDKFLSGKGLKVKTTVDGAKAIEMASEEKFDLVLCDMAMPHVYGYDVIKALNKLEERPKIGIITGWGEKLKSIDADDLKVDFIAKKPFNFNELLILINRAFSRG